MQPRGSERVSLKSLTKLPWDVSFPAWKEENRVSEEERDHKKERIALYRLPNERVCKTAHNNCVRDD